MAKGSIRGTYRARDVSQELIPVVIDHLAETDPEGVFITLTTNTGNVDISNKQYANAIDGAAWWIERQVGRSFKNEGLAYFGTGGSDFFYAVLLIAAVKAGYHMLFNSPRNSVDAHVNLFALQDCKTLIIPEPQPPYIAALLAAYPMRTLRLPSLDDFLNIESSAFEYKKTFEEARREALVSLHTSGSTGLPKPVTWTLGSAAVAANAYQVPTPEDTVPVSQLYKDDLILSAMPMFHAAGLVINVLGPVYSRHKLVLPPPGPLLSADGAISLIKSTRATVASLPPSTLDDIGRRPDLLQTLGCLNYVMAAGGIVTKTAADAINTKTTLINILGTTEFGAFSQREVDQEDWAYIDFSPVAGIQFRHYAGDEYEMVVVRDAHLERYQTCFETFPDLQELSSHDLFSKHPTKSNHWLYRGRSDDIIGFLNGEKTNPISMEGLISSLPEVKSALVLGQGRFEAALLIEPSKPSHLSVEEKAALIEHIWPTIQRANMECPTFAKISKSHILFTTPEKPMSRASKGTVQRKSTIASYSAEIDALYHDADDMKDRQIPVEFDITDLEQSVSRVLRLATGIADIRPEDDFFSRGMDSLQVIQTARLLRLVLEDSGIRSASLAPSTIYTRPTIVKLSAAIAELARDSRIAKKTDEKARVMRMAVMTDKCSVSLQPEEARNDIRRDTPRVIVLTGSTGALGSYLLEAFALCEDITHIYCLNRSAEPKQRQAQMSGSRGLAAQWDTQRVKFLTCDFAKSDLGLGHQQYTNILKDVDLIIHNAWQVDFNISLESYEPMHIQGVRNLIDFSINSHHQAQIFFISSVGTVMNWSAHRKGQVPEEVFDDFSLPLGMGYTESKFVAERLLAIANTRCNIPVSICRVGQIAGPVLGSKGIWSKQEWFPSLIMSSRHLGIIPDSLGNMEIIGWIPIDIICTIIVELALQSVAQGKSTTRTYHAVNPSVTTWTAILPYVKAAMHSEPNVVSLATWIKELRASAQSSYTVQGLQTNPALKLIDFYENLLNVDNASAGLETRQSERASPTLRELGPIRGEWVVKWMEQWNTIGSASRSSA